jgi:hypothetical protein
MRNAEEEAGRHGLCGETAHQEVCGVFFGAGRDGVVVVVEGDLEDGDREEETAGERGLGRE